MRYVPLCFVLTLTIFTVGPYDAGDTGVLAGNV